MLQKVQSGIDAILEWYRKRVLWRQSVPETYELTMKNICFILFGISVLACMETISLKWKALRSRSPEDENDIFWDHN